MITTKKILERCSVSTFVSDSGIKRTLLLHRQPRKSQILIVTSEKTLCRRDS